MKKYIFSILIIINPFYLLAQSDQIKVIGKENYIQGTLLTIDQDSILIRDSKTSSILKFQQSEVLSIKLNTIDSQKFHTKDLLNNLREHNPQNLIWIGLDFSMIKIYDPENEYKYNTGIFSAMNNLVLQKDGKFYELWFSTFSQSLSSIKKVDYIGLKTKNNKIEIQKHLVDETITKITLESIRNYLKNLEIKKYSEGIGIIFFYNSINKAREEITGYLIFFDITSREIILAWGSSQTAGGISMEWHWTKGLNILLNEIRRETKFYNNLYNLYNIN